MYYLHFVISFFGVVKNARQHNGNKNQDSRSDSLYEKETMHYSTHSNNNKIK